MCSDISQTAISLSSSNVQQMRQFIGYIESSCRMLIFTLCICHVTEHYNIFNIGHCQVVFPCQPKGLTIGGPTVTHGMKELGRKERFSFGFTHLSKLLQKYSRERMTDWTRNLESDDDKNNKTNNSRVTF